MLELAAKRATGHDVGAAVEALAHEDLLRVMLTRLVARGALHDAEVWAKGRLRPVEPALAPAPGMRQRPGLISDLVRPMAQHLRDILELIAPPLRLLS